MLKRLCEYMLRYGGPVLGAVITVATFHGFTLYGFAPFMF